jgi:hypothetical protein
MSECANNSNSPDRAPRGRAPLVLGGLALFLVAGLFVLKVTTGTKQFDPESWRSASVRDRGRMVDDLMRRDLLVGLSRSEVKRLLGPPDGEVTGWVSYRVDIGHHFISRPWLYSLNIRFRAGDDLVTSFSLDD